jgi:hypothetical protein
MTTKNEWITLGKWQIEVGILLLLVGGFTNIALLVGLAVIMIVFGKHNTKLV